jgi:hypothetical protein
MRNATSVTVSTFGVIMGLAGVEHGIGEILQGNIAPSGVMFPSWPGSPFFRIVNGEPAMSIIPNLLITGILAVLFSWMYLVWAVKFAQRKNGGRVLILLAIAMLLAGGGIFPPIIGIGIGALGTAIKTPATGWRARLSTGRGELLGKLWLLFFVVCLMAWLALFPGVNILGYFFGVSDPNLTVILILLALGSLLLTIVSGFARGMERKSISVR